MDEESIKATQEALKRYEQDGSDLDRPMLIDFFIAVPSRESGEKVAQNVEPLGFSASVEKDDVTDEWTCYCAKMLIPKVRTVVDIEEKLTAIAQIYGGYVDGFGSFGNAKEKKM